MAHIISRQQIPSKVRGPHEERYKKELRQALRNPTISLDQRAYIRTKLAESGQPKEYRTDSPLPPGAIDPRTDADISAPESVEQTPVPETVSLYPDKKNLLRLRKTQVLAVASQEEVPDVQDTMTKPQLVEAIVANREVSGWV